MKAIREPSDSGAGLGRNSTTSHTRRACLASSVIGAALLLSGCSHSRFFDIEWDEEIRLSDGRVILAHVKRSYVRMTKSRYEHVLQRSFTLTFHPGQADDVVTQTFIGLGPVMLDTDGDHWYIAMLDVSNSSSTLWPRQPPNSHSLGILRDAEFSSITIDELPTQLGVANMLIEYNSKDHELPSAEELARFDGQLVTLAMKERYIESRFTSDGSMYRLRNKKPSSDKT